MTTARKPRIAVIGGGIAGVSAAWQLRQQLGDRAQLMLAEAYGRLGGKLKTVRFSTGPVDMGAEAFLSFDQQFMELIDKLGMSSELRTPSTAHSAFLVGGTFVDIPRETLMGIPVSADVASEILSPAEAARLDAEHDGQPMTWNAGDDTTVGALVEARLGKAVVDKLVSPLLGGVYSCSAYDLGVRATLPQLAEALDRAGEGGQAFFLLDVVEELLAKRRATAVGGGGSPFRSFDKGYRSLIEEMMRQADPELILNSAVEELGRTSDGRWVIDPLGTVDAVVVATSAPTASVILEDAAPVAAEALGSVELSSSAVVGMRFASDHGIPERSGVLLGSNSGTAAKAFTVSSKKWPHLAQGGGAFVRASFGTKDEPWYVDASDRALLAYALEDLERVTGERKTPEEIFVQRWHGGIPCYGVHHSEKMSQVLEDVAGVPRLAVAGSMLRGVGVPATVASGVAAADKIIADLG